MGEPFDVAVELVLGLEGEGGTAEPGDPGGVTKWGFAQRYNSDVDVKSLTWEDAKARYKLKVWDALRLDRLPAPLDVAVFNAAVNPGPHEAVVALQEALIVKVDGVLGPVTVAVAEKKMSQVLLEDFHARLAYYYASRLEFAKEGHGWLRRLFVVFAVCLQMIPKA